MNHGWYQATDTALSEINITPLVDVALVLLIIFMITAPMLVQGADVRLPETRPMDTLPPEGLFITVTADGEIFVNEVPVSLEELESRLLPLASPGRMAFLRADRDLPYGTVMQVLERLRRAELQIGLVTEPVPGQNR